MDALNITMRQKHEGEWRALYPFTKAENILYGDKNLKDIIDALMDSEKIFISDENPGNDGIWIDQDLFVDISEKNPAINNFDLYDEVDFDNKYTTCEIQEEYSIEDKILALESKILKTIADLNKMQNELSTLKNNI